MPADECPNPQIPLEGDNGQRVREVMIPSPKTLPATTTVGGVRELFSNDHVRLALLTEGDHFIGAIERDELQRAAGEELPARSFIQSQPPTIGPDRPVSEALSILSRRGLRRLVVVDPGDGRLLGLLCLTRDGSGFCQS